MDFRGQTALITGASSGIGAEFSRELARRGANVVLVARSEDKLKKLAEELTTTWGVSAAMIAADLSEPGAASGLCAELADQQVEVDVLVNSVGFGVHAPMVTAEADRLSAMTLVNVLAVEELCRAYLPGMLARDRGTIINISSLAAYMPTPYMTVYGATKAFVLSLSQGLWAECRKTGVRIIAVCPGPVDTGYFDVAGESPGNYKRIPPQRVVEVTMRGLKRRKSAVVPGVFPTAMATFMAMLPRQTAARVTELSARSIKNQA